MRDNTVFEVNTRCVRCGEKSVLNAVLDKNQAAVNVEWVCPNCGAKRVITISRAEAKESVEKDSKTVKHYKIVDGNRVEIDDEGNEKFKPSTQFKITSPKKKKEAEIPFTVSKVE